MPFTTGAMIDEGGVLIAPPPAQPQVSVAAATPTVAPTDALDRYINNIAPTEPAPIVANAPTPEYIAQIDAQVAPAVAAAQSLLAGGSAQDMAIAAEAAGAGPEEIAAILATGIPGTSSVAVASTAPTPSGADIGIDNMPDVQELGHDDQSGFDVLGYFPALDGYELLSVGTLSGQAFIDYVRKGCEKRDLDALAVLANAYSEGLGGGIGDGGTSYGPWQMHDGGALPKKYWNQGKNVARIQTWAWSTPGIDYALDCMAKTSAKGKRGRDAVYALVYEFERPAQKDVQYLIRVRTYGQLASMGGGAYAWLAQFAHGPAKGTATATAPVAAAPQPAKIIGTWRDLITTLRDDMPRAAIHMQNTAKRLRGTVT